MSATKTSNKATKKITSEPVQVESNINETSIKLDLNLDLSEFIDYDFNTSDINKQRETYVKLVNEINSLIARVKTLDNIRCDFLEKMQINSNDDVLTGIHNDFDSDDSDEMSEGEVVETKTKKTVENKTSKKTVTTESESEANVEKPKRGKAKKAVTEEPVEESVTGDVEPVKPKRGKTTKKATDSSTEQTSSETESVKSQDKPKRGKKSVVDIMEAQQEQEVEQEAEQEVEEVEKPKKAVAKKKAEDIIIEVTTAPIVEPVVEEQVKPKKTRATKSA